MLGRQCLLMILGSRFALAGLLGTGTSGAPGGRFGLYAYGGSISGAHVFYSKDAAFIGDQTQMDDDEAARVVFTTGPDNALIGNPDMDSSRGFPSWSDRAFFVPTSTSSSHHVGFTSRGSEPDADTDTSGFVFYGATALHQNPDGTLHGLWYAVPTPSKRIWVLRWNATSSDGTDDDHVLVSLRSTAPARPFK